MRVETSALVTLKKRLRNRKMLMRMAEGATLGCTMVWGCVDTAAVPLDSATRWVRSIVENRPV